MSMPEQDQLRPDLEMITNHIRTAKGDVLEGLFEIMHLKDVGGVKQVKSRLFSTDQIEEAAQYAHDQNMVEGWSAYMTAAILSPDTAPMGRPGDGDFYESTHVWADYDKEGDAERAAEKVKNDLHLMPDFSVVTGMYPYLRIQVFIKTEPIHDPALLVRLNEAFAHTTNGDSSVINPSRVMRLGGTIAWPAKPGRVAEMTRFFKAGGDFEYSPEMLQRVLGAGMPGMTGMPVGAPANPFDSLLRGKVQEGHRDAYRRDVIHACFVEYVGQNGCEPTHQELFDVAHPIIERGIGHPDAAPEIRKTHRKVDYLLGRFAAGRLPNLPTLKAVVESYRQRTEQKAAEQQRAEERAERASGITLQRTSDFLDGWKAPDYLVDGILQRGYLYATTAKTGHGKTAVCIELALLTVAGGMLGPYEVQKGRVVYLCGENPDDVRARLVTICRVRGIDPNDLDIYWVDGTFDIQQAHKRLVDEIERIGGASLVIVDTLAAFFQGDDDNSNVQMAQYARDVLRPITQMAGHPCVIVPAHPVKDPRKDNLVPRGGGAFLNEIDGNLTLWSDGDGVTQMSWAGKIRGPTFNPIDFALEEIRHHTVTDSRGRPMTSIMARVVTDVEAEGRVKAAVSEENELLQAIKDLPNGSIRAWAEHVGWFNALGVPVKSKVQRRIATLKDEKLVESKRGKYRITKAGEDELARSYGTYKAKPWRKDEF